MRKLCNWQEKTLESCVKKCNSTLYLHCTCIWCTKVQLMRWSLAWTVMGPANTPSNTQVWTTQLEIRFTIISVFHVDLAIKITGICRAACSFRNEWMEISQGLNIYLCIMFNYKNAIDWFFVQLKAKLCHHDVYHSRGESLKHEFKFWLRGFRWNS